MKVIRGISHISKFKRPVIALGVFDGVHRGHKTILQGAVRKARSINGTSMVLTFWPHPQKQESLYSLEHRLRLMEKLGIDVCLVINFNKKFSGITAASFVKNILFKKMGANFIYVGENFRFGKNAQGGLKTLEELSREYKFKLRAFKVSRIKKATVSSTYIRKLIKGGDLVTAQKLLTRPVSVLGTVIKGVSLARKLGFPTANIDPHHEVIPPSGVYAVRVIFNKMKLNGICNIGTKPTFKLSSTESATHIELHIFDFKKNIYGKYLEIQFIKKIREERKFESSVELIEQIKKDITTARKRLSLHQ